MSTVSESSVVKMPPPQSFEIGDVDVYGTVYTKDIAARTSLNAKVQNFMKSAKVQKLLSEKGEAPTAILISKKEGFRLQFGDEIHTVGTFEDLENPSWWNRITRSTHDYFTFRDLAGKELYEALNELEKEKLLSDANRFINQRNSPAPSAHSHIAEYEAADPKTIAWNHSTLQAASEKAACVVDTNSVYRNLGGFISNTVELGSKAVAVTAVATAASGILSGALGVLNGAYGATKNFYLANQARKIGDTPGIKNSLLNASVLMSYGTVSGAMTVLFSSSVAGASAGAAASVLTYSGLAMGGFLTWKGIRGISAARKFSQEMDAILNSKKSEDERLIEALLTLKQKVTLTDAEYGKVQGNPEEIKKLMLKKGADFARATSDACLEQLLKFDAQGNFELDNLINGILSQKAEKKTEAKDLLQKVYQANYTTKVKSISFLALGIITIGAFLVDYFLTGGIGNFIFMIGAGLWFWVDSTKIGDWVSERIWSDRAVAVLPDVLKTDDQKKGAKSQTLVGLKITGAVATSFVWAPILYFWLEYLKPKLDQTIQRLEEEQRLHTEQKALLASTAS